MAPSQVKLAEYLFTRLLQLGVQSIHGVPGDYNLQLLDFVEPSGLQWVGNCNELNAGYAADGYARIKGLGALITTFGVGELSAANAIAGAYAELAPVVHIVGTPARESQDTRARIHHTFNDGNYRRFGQMHAHITVAQASLRDPRTCPQEIDTTIQQCLIHSRPVYIEVPVDMVDLPVSAERLQTKIEIPAAVLSTHEEPALEYVLSQISQSQRPMILVDGECWAYKIVDEVHEIIKKTNWPIFVSSFGKGLIEESLPSFRGVWKGASASKEDQDFVKERDLILCFGPHFSTTNTYQKSSIPDPTVTVHFYSTSVEGPGKKFSDLPSKPFLTKLLEKLDPSKITECEITAATQNGATESDEKIPDGLITQYSFYRTLSPFLRSGDIVLGETGTPGYGCRDMRLPPQTRLFKPITWLSIGYMLPAAQGAALAQRQIHAAVTASAGAGASADPQSTPVPRTILLIGDGSFQMTVQELSTIIREQLNVTIILVNNNGYTIERCIHGRKQKYNDVAPWRYLQAPAFFGGNNTDHPNYPTHTFTVRTWADLDRVLNDRKMSEGVALRMVEVFMEEEDAPVDLLGLLNAQKERERAAAERAASKSS